MEADKNTLRIFLIFNSLIFLFSLLITLDYTISKNHLNGVVENVVYGEESGYSGTNMEYVLPNNKKLTHYQVINSVHSPFLISKDNVRDFKINDSITISVSKILNQSSHIVNNENGFSTKPIKGIFSNYIIAGFILLILSTIGIIRFKSIKTQVNLFALLLFLGAFTLILIYS